MCLSSFFYIFIRTIQHFFIRIFLSAFYPLIFGYFGIIFGIFGNGID